MTQPVVQRVATWGIPIVGVLVAAASWGRHVPTPLAVLVGVLLAACVLVSVFHAESVAHRVGQPLSSLVLAISVTIIEVALVATLMITGGPDKASLARDTVFAAVMITCNGIVGVCLLVATRRSPHAVFNPEGTGASLAAITLLASMTLVLPTFTVTSPGPTFTTPQLLFAATASLVIYALYVYVQTVRHRDDFVSADDGASSGSPPPQSLPVSLALLLASLIAVVGLSKAVSPALESAVTAGGLPLSFVGVVIAILVLLPEGVTAVRMAQARRDTGDVQGALNLSYGSAMASIGLTIPAIALVSLWLHGPLLLGLGPTQLVLLALTVVISMLTVAPGRATPLQAGIHLTLFAGFIVMAASP